MQEQHYRIERPREYSPENGEELSKLINSSEVRQAISKVQNEYLPWAEFKNKTWIPGNKEAIWFLVRLQRDGAAERTIISDKDNKIFTFNPHLHAEFLHHIDLDLGGAFMGVDSFNEGDKKYFIKQNTIEESIASSQLEGANTSRQVAQKMLMEGRKPRNHSEQMIVNNHETMKWIEEKLKNENLSIDLLQELHRKITFKTINDKHYGVFRETLDEDGQPLVIKPWDQNVVTYTAPPKEFVEKEINKLIDFANDRDNSVFIHPLTKAIMLHFWIGLLHPFEDGNGRLARIIFYWYMLRKGYWAFSYVSLSKYILKSSKQYSMAYIYSEQDKNDLNYFINYNVEKLQLAREEFKKYIKRKVLENASLNNIVAKSNNLNIRQVMLLKRLFHEEQKFSTLFEYKINNHAIGKITAVSDLKKLVTEGYLKKVRNGRNIFYYPTEKIKEIFR